MLELKNVTKSFNLTGAKEDERIALNNVSLQIKPGDFVTIIGGNGSGKSTSLNIFSGALKPDKGQVLLNGVDITKLSEHQRASYFGRVFQDPMMGTAGEMSVLENLEIAYRRGRNHSPFRWGFKKANKERFINELKRFDLGLEDRLNQKVGVMSGGQRQALTLLMATIRDTPTIKKMKNDFITFSGLEKSEAKEMIEKDIKEEQIKRENLLIKLKGENISKNARKQKIEEFDSQSYHRLASKYDLTKQILLLDEHTAALDPKTAKKVLELTDKIVHENQMTTLMVTHNMRDALLYGNRLIMFYAGHIVMDVSGKEKAKLTSADLLKKFDELDYITWEKD